MRRFVLGTLLGIAVLNCFLAYSGQNLAGEMDRSFRLPQRELPILTQTALVVAPYFYLVAVAALAIPSLGFLCRLRQEWLIYATVSLLVVDIAGLFLSLWGFCIPFFLIGEILTK